MDCRETWGDSNVVDTVAWLGELGDNLPSTTKAELLAACLPLEVAPLYSSAPPERIELSSAQHAVKFGLAWHGEYAMCLTETSGRVVSKHLIADEITPVNTGLREFSQFLAITSRISQLYDRVEDGKTSREDYLHVVESARMELSKIDSSALEPGAWWSGIVEEFSMI
ncbi:SUKH-4 family immunity protein [Microlunatus parietis]|nr:SUKH-4 family immunity protein [Microlunatus parietis]